MRAPPKMERAAPGRKAARYDSTDKRILPYRLRVVHRLHDTATACGLSAVFVDEAPLRCEVFDPRGRLFGTWRARR